MSKNTKQIDNLEEVDTIDEYAELKTEISDRVRAIGVNKMFAADGCVNYHLEADGTMWMQYGDVRRATNRWEREDWNRFQRHCKAGLWDKIKAQFGKHKTTKEHDNNGTDIRQ